MSRKVRNAGLIVKGTESNGLNLFFQTTGIVDQGLGHNLLYYQLVLISSIKPISNCFSLSDSYKSSIQIQSCFVGLPQ